MTAPDPDARTGWSPPPAPRRSPAERARALARGAAAPLLHAARRGDPRLVVWTPPALGGGNHLYMWLYAHARRRAGEDVRVLAQPGMEAWLHMFPALAPLTVARADVPWRARREEVWNQSYDHSGRAVLDAFLDDALLSSPRFSALLADTPAAPAVVNMRRGDYYADAAFRAQYGMDIRAYLAEALPLAGIGDGPITVVSDAPEWCRETLPRWFPGPRWEVPGREHGMFGDLAHLARAERLVLANSTFSYWGGYLCERLAARDGRAAAVVAPRFHVRTIHGGAAWQLSPTWRVVDNVERELAAVPDGG